MVKSLSDFVYTVIRLESLFIFVCDYVVTSLGSDDWTVLSTSENVLICEETKKLFLSNTDS